jgi:hypothetical protein
MTVTTTRAADAGSRPGASHHQVTLFILVVTSDAPRGRRAGAGEGAGVSCRGTSSSSSSSSPRSAAAVAVRSRSVAEVWVPDVVHHHLLSTG